MGEESGYIPFEEAEAAQKSRAAAILAEEGALVVKKLCGYFGSCNCARISVTLIGEEAEKEYWDLLRGNQEKYKGNRGRGGKFNRGGREFKGKHCRAREN